jgi:hypothetical protein
MSGQIPALLFLQTVKYIFTPSMLRCLPTLDLRNESSVRHLVAWWITLSLPKTRLLNRVAEGLASEIGMS